VVLRGTIEKALSGVDIKILNALSYLNIPPEAYRGPVVAVALILPLRITSKRVVPNCFIGIYWALLRPEGKSVTSFGLDREQTGE